MAKKKNPAGGQLSTKLVYLDLSTILANYRDPKFWGKEWTIYKSGNLEIYWVMTRIDVRDNAIKSEVHVRTFTYKNRKLCKTWYDGRYYCGQECKNIPIDNPDYSQEAFETNILGTCLFMVGRVEVDIITGYAEYQTALRLEEQNREALKEIAEQVADNRISVLRLAEQNREARNGIADDHISIADEYASTIREAIIEKYLDDHEIDYTGEVLRNYDHRVLGSVYLMLCSWFGNERLFDEHKNRIGDNKKKHVWLDMLRKAKEIQTDEWRNAMAEELQDALEAKKRR